jgi:hypothetical protein
MAWIKKREIEFFSSDLDDTESFRVLATCCRRASSLDLRVWETLSFTVARPTEKLDYKRIADYADSTDKRIVFLCRIRDICAIRG